MAKPTPTADNPPTREASHTTSRASSRTDFHMAVLPQYLDREPRAQRFGSPCNTISTAISKACSLFVLALLHPTNAARRSANAPPYPRQVASSAGGDQHGGGAVVYRK